MLFFCPHIILPFDPDASTPDFLMQTHTAKKLAPVHMALSINEIAQITLHHWTHEYIVYILYAQRSTRGGFREEERAKRSRSAMAASVRRCLEQTISRRCQAGRKLRPPLAARCKLWILSYIDILLTIDIVQLACVCVYCRCAELVHPRVKGMAELTH